MAVKGEVIFYDNGGSEMPGPRANKSTILYEFIQECKLPYQRGANIPSGSRSYEPVVVVKQIDKLTPLLWKCLTEGAVLKKVEIILYEISEAIGSETPYFKYTLENARIASIVNWMPPQYDDEEEIVGHLEKVSLVAQVYNWEHLTAKTLHVDEGFFEAAMK
jgi:type VI secretion system secreted protein Hcp